MRETPTFLSPRAERLSAPAVSSGAARQAVVRPRRGVAASSDIPGEAGLWLFILGDMLIFGAFFSMFLIDRAGDPETFARGRETMTVAFGAVNTLVLLTSSLLVAVSVQAHRAGRRVEARRLVALAGLCAAAFATIKITEWAIKIADGHAPGDSLFHTYYYALTGVHFLHLLIGVGALAFWWRLLARPPKPARDERRLVGACASYWHMVDLLWIVLFPVLYLSAT